MASRQRLVAVGAALLLAFVVAFPLTSSARPGPYARAKLRCDRVAAVGATITVAGTGFQPDAGVVVEFDSPPASTTTRTSSAGTFSTPFTVPTGAAEGRHEITATVSGGGDSVVIKTCVVRVRG